MVEKLFNINIYKGASNVFKKSVLLDYNLLTKLNISNLYFIPKVSSLVVTMHIDSADLQSSTDSKIINSLDFLDFVSDQQAGIDLYTSKYIKRKRSIIFISKSTLNKWGKIYKFTVFLNKVIKPFLERRDLRASCQYFSNGFNLIIKDITSLDEIPNTFKQEKFYIKVSFFVKNVKINNNILKLLKQIIF